MCGIAGFYSSRHSYTQEKERWRAVLEDMKDGDYKYWRDAEGVHHVPKRKLEELIVR